MSVGRNGRALSDKSPAVRMDSLPWHARRFNGNLRSMIKHLVFWKLKEHALGRDRAENALLIKQELEALDGRIPGLLKIEVGIDFVRGETSSDVALYTELESREALAAYQAHPLHKAAGGAFRDAISERRSVDYEI